MGWVVLVPGCGRAGSDWQPPGGAPAGRRDRPSRRMAPTPTVRASPLSTPARAAASRKSLQARLIVGIQFVAKGSQRPPANVAAGFRPWSCPRNHHPVKGGTSPWGVPARLDRVARQHTWTQVHGVRGPRAWREQRQDVRLRATEESGRGLWPARLGLPRWNLS